VLCHVDAPLSRSLYNEPIEGATQAFGYNSALTRFFSAAVAPDDPELLALLDSYAELLEALRRLTTLSERLLERAEGRKPLTSQEAADARRELEITRSIERLEAMLTMRRQKLRVMQTIGASTPAARVKGHRVLPRSPAVLARHLARRHEDSPRRPICGESDGHGSGESSAPPQRLRSHRC
jgi:hypothetical protein